MGNLNIKKFVISMLVFFAIFVAMSVGFIITDVWELWSKEVGMTLSMGFCISAVINLLKKENYGN